jgi:hypothetical protein
MIRKLIALIVSGTFSMVAAGLAQDVGQILNVRIATDGKIKDESKEPRRLETKNVELSSDRKSVTLESIDAITIPYSVDDPIYKNGPQTWIFRIKMPDALAAPSSCLTGRWNSGENRRSLGLLLQGNEGRLQFLISADGTAETTLGVATRDALPAGEWLVAVAKYQPGAQMELLLFDEAGELLDSRKTAANVPASFFEDEMPILVGAPKEVAMEFSNFQIWSRILSDAQLKKELRDLQ